MFWCRSGVSSSASLALVPTVVCGGVSSLLPQAASRVEEAASKAAARASFIGMGRSAIGSEKRATLGTAHDLTMT